MTDSRFAITQFCDDIRQEVGNKVSLMGCYSGELLVEQFPVVLPKLCAQIKVVTPRSEPFERLVLRAYLNDDLLGEVELPVEQANKALRSIDPAAKRMTFGAVMTFAPFVIEKEGSIHIEAESEEGTLKAGRMRLMLTETHLRELEAAAPDRSADQAARQPI